LQFVGDFLLAEGLHEIFVGSGGKRRGHALYFSLSRHHHEGQIAEAILLANGLHELQTIHLGHIPIDQNNVGTTLVVKTAERFFAVAGLGYVKAKLPEHVPQNSPQDAAVIHN
jgi:hypothetical protein